MRVVYAQNVGLDPNLEGDVGLVLTQARAKRFNVVLRQAPAIKFLAVVPENDGQWSQLKFGAFIKSGQLKIVVSSLSEETDCDRSQDGLVLPWPELVFFGENWTLANVLIFDGEEPALQLQWVEQPELQREQLVASTPDDARQRLNEFGAVVLPAGGDVLNMSDTIDNYLKVSDSFQGVAHSKLFIGPQPFKCGCPFCVKLLNFDQTKMSEAAKDKLYFADGYLRLKGDAAASDASVVGDAQESTAGQALMTALNSSCRVVFAKEAIKLAEIRRGAVWSSDQHPHTDFSRHTNALSAMVCLTPRHVDLWLGSHKPLASNGWGQEPIKPIRANLLAHDVLIFSHIMHRGVRQPPGNGHSKMLHAYLSEVGTDYFAYEDRINQSLSMAKKDNFRNFLWESVGYIREMVKDVKDVEDVHAMWRIDPGARIWRVPALLQNYFRSLRLHHQNALSRVNEIVVDNMEGEDMEGGEEDLGNPRRSSSSSTAATPSCLTTAVDAINSVGDIYNSNAQRLPSDYDSANEGNHSGPNILVPFSGGVDSTHILYHLCEESRIPPRRIFPVFIDGLNVAAKNREREACTKICQTLSLGLYVVRLNHKVRKQLWDMWRCTREELDEPPWRNQFVVQLCEDLIARHNITAIAIDGCQGQAERRRGYFSDLPTSYDLFLPFLRQRTGLEVELMFDLTTKKRKVENLMNNGLLEMTSTCPSQERGRLKSRMLGKCVLPNTCGRCEKDCAKCFEVETLFWELNPAFLHDEPPRASRVRDAQQGWPESGGLNHEGWPESGGHTTPASPAPHTFEVKIDGFMYPVLDAVLQGITVDASDAVAAGDAVAPLHVKATIGLFTNMGAIDSSNTSTVTLLLRSIRPSATLKYPLHKCHGRAYDAQVSAWVPIRVKHLQPLMIVRTDSGKEFYTSSHVCFFPEPETEGQKPKVALREVQCRQLPAGAKAWVVDHQNLPARIMRTVHTPGMVRLFLKQDGVHEASIANQLNGFEAKDFFTLRDGISDEIVAAWNARLFNDGRPDHLWRYATTGVCNGYEKASEKLPARTHTAWNWTMSAVMYFLATKIIAHVPPGATVMDVCMGGGGRALMALWLGFDFFGCDIRRGVVDGVTQLYNELQHNNQLIGEGTFVQCDARQLLHSCRKELGKVLGKVWMVIGSWEFWKAESSNGGIDKDEPYMQQALERCATYPDFLVATKKMLLNVASCLNPGGIIMLHMPAKIHCPKTKKDINWIFDLTSYASQALGLDTSHRQVVFVNKLGSAPRHAVSTFAKRRRLQPQTEYVVTFSKRGYNIIAPKFPTTAKNDLGTRRQMTDNEVIQWRASYDPLVGVRPDAYIQLRKYNFESNKSQGSWQGGRTLADLRKEGSDSDLTQGNFALSWRFEYPNATTSRRTLAEAAMLAHAQSGEEEDEDEKDDEEDDEEGAFLNKQSWGESGEEGDTAQSGEEEDEDDDEDLPYVTGCAVSIAAFLNKLVTVDLSAGDDARLFNDGRSIPSCCHHKKVAALVIEAMPENKLDNVIAHIVGCRGTSGTGTTIVTHDGQQVVAVAIVCHADPEITCFAVAERLRRLGCGRHLMSTLQRRWKRLVVKTEPDQSAINFYHAVGFSTMHPPPGQPAQVDEHDLPYVMLQWDPSQFRRSTRLRLSVSAARDNEQQVIHARGTAQRACERLIGNGWVGRAVSLGYSYPDDISGSFRSGDRAIWNCVKHGGGIVFYLENFHWVCLTNPIGEVEPVHPCVYIPKETKERESHAWYIDDSRKCVVHNHAECCTALEALCPSRVDEVLLNGEVQAHEYCYR